MNFKKVVALILVFALSLSLVACGGEKNTANNKENDSANVDEEKVLTFGGPLDGVGNLDVHLTTINEIFQITAHVQEGLLGLNTETLEVEPVLLTKLPEVSEDGLTYSCELKPDVKFHDGTVLTSNDVKYTFERIFTPATKNVNTWLCDMILGAKDMLDGKADELKGFKIIDDTHFEITLEKPYSAFMSVLAATQMVIYPEKACKEAGDDWGGKVFIGTGPFKVKEFDPKNKVVLERFDDYHDGPKKLDEIVFLNMDPNTALLEFENGTIDVTALDVSLVDNYLKNDKFKDNVKKCDSLGIVTLGLNKAMKPLDDVKVREAVGLAIDRKGLTENYLRGKAVPATCFIPKGIPGYDENAPEFEYNPEKAKQLLSEAGYPDGIELTVIISEKSTLAPILEVIQQQLKESNIDLTIQKVDHAANLDIGRRGEKQVSIINWYADIIDADNFFYSILYGDSSKAFSTNYYNKEFDAMCDKARTIVDVDEKSELYKKIEHKVTREDFMLVPLYNPVFYYLVSDRVDGAVMMQTSLYRFTDADIVK